MTGVSLFQTRRYPTGELIVLADDPAVECFVVHSGQVELLAPDGAGMLVSVGTRGPGHVFGELGLAERRTYRETVRAVRESVCVAIPRSAIAAKTAAADPFVGALVNVLAGNLVRMIDRKQAEQARRQGSDNHAPAGDRETDTEVRDGLDDLEGLIE